MSAKRSAASKTSKHTAGKGKVVVATVHGTEVSAFFHSSMLKLVMADMAGRRQIANVLTEVSSANISSGRNKLVAKFLDENKAADWLLFIDSDMYFEPDLIDGLLHNASPDQAPIVGGLCFGVNDGILFPTIYTLAQHEGKVVTARHHGPIPADTMMQVAATGSACILIHRTVLEAIRGRAFNETFPWFQETELFGKPCGEDITFCIRAGQVGAPVYVFTSVQVGHHKSTILDLAAYERQAN